MNVDLEGTIHPTSLPSLLYSVCDTKETGQLLLRREKAEKNVYLKGGRIIFSSSSNREDRLGQFLLRQGVTGVEQLYRATEASSGSNPGTGLPKHSATWKSSMKRLHRARRLPPACPLPTRTRRCLALCSRR